MITETFYNTLGEVDWTSAAYYDDSNAAPSTTLGTPQGQIPSITQHLYDGAGRETATIFKALGAEKWRTMTGDGGDRLNTTPPVGGTATTAITNVFNQTVELRQYRNPADVGSNDPSKFDKTGYTYDLNGQLTKVVDAAGNEWRYEFDLRGRQTKVIDPDKGTGTTTYDVAGNVATTTAPLGATTATLGYTYDAIGRRTSVRDGSPTGAKRAEWVYDTLPNGAGKLTKSIRWIGSVAYESRVGAYDTFGRPTSTSVVIPSSEGALCAAPAPNPCTYTPPPTTPSGTPPPTPGPKPPNFNQATNYTPPTVTPSSSPLY